MRTAAHISGAALPQGRTGGERVRNEHFVLALPNNLPDRHVAQAIVGSPCAADLTAAVDGTRMVTAAEYK